MPSATACGTDRLTDMKENPLLTVVMPVYNTAAYLDEAVDSVLGQTLRDIEVILVDDGSSDGSGAICEARAARDPRVRVIHKANGGLGAARNTGMADARGKYIAFADSDDIVLPETYATAVEMLESAHASQVSFSYQNFADGTTPVPGDLTAAPRIYKGADEMRRIALAVFSQPYADDERFHLPGSSCMAVYRMDIIRDNGITFENDRVSSEDFLFGFLYFMASDSVIWLDRPYYLYRQTAGSLSRGLRLDRMTMIEDMCRRISEYLAAKGMDPSTDVYAHGYYANNLRVVIKQVLGSKELTLKQKRQWFAHEMSRPYMACLKTYPCENMTAKQRLLHKSLTHKLFWPAIAMAMWQNRKS